MKSLPDLLFGPKHHYYGQLGQYERNVKFSDHPGDGRYVLFTLKAIWRKRNKGPKWAQKAEHVGYIVHWSVFHGIPIGNTKDGYKTVKAADIEIAAEDYWGDRTATRLEEQIREIRINNGFYWEGGEYYRANNE
jgi:hypothetical protein